MFKKCIPFTFELIHNNSLEIIVHDNIVLYILKYIIPLKILLCVTYINNRLISSYLIMAYKLTYNLKFRLK